ncbi:radical SAM protein [Desulfococcus sp.]|uniref:radical SAM protein n=1 Tax=Desulfococcus sp. TaxID=2025834 RepID=UPI0035939D3A
MALIQNRQIAVRTGNCIHCGFCTQYIACPAGTDGCIGCGACVAACPQAARDLKIVDVYEAAGGEGKWNLIDFEVNGQAQQLPGPLSVSKALTQLGVIPEREASSACGTGGCWNCAVLIDGQQARGCVTALRSGMKIVTRQAAIRQVSPKRVVTVMRPAPHGHPSIFTHGCNYRCDLCHNWDLTFSSTATSLTPSQAIAQLGLRPEKDRWIGISGGEPTLNRQWLVDTVRELRGSVPESRIQLDTNASLLTPDYIDELIAAGVTDVSPDFKALEIKTFMTLSGVHDKNLAKRYMQTIWQAIEHLQVRYADQVFMAVSIPCHPRIHTRSELEEMAVALATLNPDIPVTLTELQPAFRSRNWPHVTRQVMDEAADVLENNGLRRVMIQGGQGIPRAMEPSELALSTEDF